MMVREQAVLTVILPTYNAGHSLLPAVQSVLAQTFTNFELLVLDDGSTDRSIASLNSIDDQRLKIISDGENRGLAYRLNQGIGLSHGQFIARMDADDLCFPTRFERQIDYLNAHPDIDLLATRAIVFGAEKRIIGLLPFRPDHASICERPWLTLPMPHPTWMAKRAWYARNLYRLPEYIRAEDQELLLRTMGTSQFACLDEVLLAYRQGPFNLRKTFRARLSQLSAQFTYFMAIRAFKMMALSGLAFLAKSLIDVAAAIPGLETLFFTRMGEQAPLDIVTKTEKIIEEY